MKKAAYIFLFVFPVLSCLSALAQSGKATAVIDSSNILIGDHAHVKFSYTVPSKAIISWPVFQDTLTKEIEIISKSKLDTAISDDNNNVTYSQTLTITCFDSGSYTIPAIRFSHRMPGDTTVYSDETLPLMLMVNTIPVDTTQAIKDIKGILGAPITLMEILPWVALGLLGAAVITLVIILIIRKKKNKPLFGRVKPQTPAHIKALEALEELRAQHLWQEGKIKEYHSRLTDIVRTYIEERFSVKAMEMITSEVIENLSKLNEISPDNLKNLDQMLQLADRVKFAKFIPLPDEHDTSMKHAVQFVSETAPKPEPETHEEKTADSENHLSETEVK